jgi:phosphatidylinositol glycan class B
MNRHNPYIKLGLLALLLGHGIAAFTSFGFHHPDEHFQILEWANYFVGNTPDGSHLPWEFAAQIRPWFQPMIHAFFIKLFTALGIYEPFSAAVFFRLAYAFANIWSLLALWNHFQKKYNLSEKWFLVLGSMWFFPYIHVRTSSENLAGIFTSFALLSLVKSPASFFKAGLLFGFAFITRNQIALGLAGIAAALLIRDRGIRKGHWILFGGFLIPVGIGTLLDRWGYGSWVFTPYLYYKVNIVQNVAATFNPYPWYQYLIWILELLPFISIPLFYGMLRFCFRDRLNLFGWFSLSFFILHWFITNKEYRFLFPILNFVPLMAFAYFQNQSKLTRFGSKPILLVSYLIISVLAFCVSSLHGAAIKMLGAHHAVHAVSSDYPGSNWISNRNFIGPGKYPMPFYDVKKVKGFKVENFHAFESISGMKELMTQFPDSLVLIDGYYDQITIEMTQVVESAGCKLVYNPLNSKASKYIRTPYQVVYHCGSN